MRKERFISAVREQRTTLLGLLEPLSDEQWSTLCPSAPPAPDVIRLDEPGRTVAQVVAHLLIVNERALAKTAAPRGGLRRPERLGGWDIRCIEPLVEKGPAELVALLARQSQRLERMIAGAPAIVHHVPLPGTPGHVARLIEARVLHQWLHGQDIAAGLGVGPHALQHTTSAVPEVLADATLMLLPAEALPRIDLARGVVRMIVDASGSPGGGGQRRIWGLDFGRRQYGPRVVRPADATIRLHATTLAMVVHGRSDRLANGGGVEVDGDRELADLVMDAMAAPRAMPVCRDRAAATAAPAGSVGAELPSLY